MRILYLVGGNDVIAGGATVRDAVFVQGLRDAGHDVIPVSLYGPAGLEGEPGYCPVFHALGRNTLRRFFPRLSRVPSKISAVLRRPRPVMSMTSIAVSGKRADARGPLAVSLLSGANKMQRREFARLVDYLAARGTKPDAAILANTMLSGLAEPLKANFESPVFCLSQGSDRMIEALEEPYRSDARKLARKNARLFRRVIAASRSFAIRATESLSLPASRVRIVPPGIDARALVNPAPRSRLPFTVGYLAPIRKDKGLDILVDAVETLVRDTAVKPELRVAGRVEDDRYWSRIRRRLETKEMAPRHKIFGELGARERRDFMEGLSVFVAPSREPESRATHVLEAMAAGVPVIGPASGIIPEIFQRANGGLLVSSEAPSWMFAQALELLASMPDTADEMGRMGSEGVAEHFSAESSAKSLAEIIAECV